jgi:hypothetical protein
VGWTDPADSRRDGLPADDGASASARASATSTPSGSGKSGQCEDLPGACRGAAAAPGTRAVPLSDPAPGTSTDAGEAAGGLPELSAELLREHGDDPLRAADRAEPIAVLVAHHVAEELRATGSQPGDGGVDVVDTEGDAADAEGVGRRG